MKFCFLLTLLLLPVLTWAEDEQRWYKVEIIVFANTSMAGLQEEKWPDNPGIPNTTNAISLIDNTLPQGGVHEGLVLPGQPVEFQQIPLETLSSSLNILRRSSRYRVLYTSAWLMAGLPLSSSLPVRISAGKGYLEDGEPAPPVHRGGAVPADINRYSFADQQLIGSQPEMVLNELDGRVRISLSKFLDVDADLIYRTHVMLPDTLGNMVKQFQSFRLTEFRRMKSNTIHYLDHPMLGAVIAINRYEAPLPAPSSNLPSPTVANPTDLSNPDQTASGSTTR